MLLVSFCVVCRVNVVWVVGVIWWCVCAVVVESRVAVDWSCEFVF